MRRANIPLPYWQIAARELERRARLAEAPPLPTFRGANLAIQTYQGQSEATIEFVLSGPAETGKSWATIWLLDSLCRQNPNEHYVMARKTLASIWGTCLITYKTILDYRHKMGDPMPEAYGGEKPEFYTYPNGTRLWIGGMDNASKILSGERAGFYANQLEEFELNDWETVLTRVTGRGTKVEKPIAFGDCNPGAEDHWIMKRPELTKFYSKHVDNPSLYNEDGTQTPQGERSIATLKSLTGIRRKRLYEGLWVGSEGLFFEELDEDLHLIKPFPIPKDAPIWASLDHGFKHATAIGIYTEIDKEIIKIAEHEKSGWLPKFHAERYFEMLDALGIQRWRVKKFVAGHDVFAVKGDENGRTIAQQYLDFSIRLEHASIERASGALELLTRLGNAEMKVKPTFKMFDTCTKTFACLRRMVHDPSKNVTAKEDVLKVDGDDLYDETRYGVMARKSPSSSAPAVGGKRSA